MLPLFEFILMLFFTLVVCWKLHSQWLWFIWKYLFSDYNLSNATIVFT